MSNQETERTPHSEPRISGNPETGTPWVMQIVVHDTKDFSQVALNRAVAYGVVRLLDSVQTQAEYDALEAWSAGRFRKVVRRAKGSAWAKVGSVPGLKVNYDGVEVHVCFPVETDKVPPVIRATQVSGLSVVPGPVCFESEGAPVELCTSAVEGMSPGKCAAALAHAAQMAYQKMTDTQRNAWREDGYPMTVALGETFTSNESDFVVRDAGLTEVAPGTVTAMGRFAF